MYNVRWVARENEWEVGRGILDMPLEMGEEGEQAIAPPVMLHQDVQLKRKAQVSVDVADGAHEGVAVLTFDGGSAKKLGTGGYTCWLPSGQLATAQALWYGQEHCTNNEAELATLVAALEWLAERQQELELGPELLVLGDSNIVIGFMNKRYKPQRKFVPGVLRCRELLKQLGVRA